MFYITGLNVEKDVNKGLEYLYLGEKYNDPKYDIVKAKVEFKKLKLYFTTDLDQNSTSLKKSLYEFVKDEATGKVKTNNIELNILG